MSTYKINVPESGGTITAATYDSCITALTMDTSADPQQIVTNTAATSGNFVITCDSNAHTNPREWTYTLYYNHSGGMCEHNIHIVQEAADVPKVILTLTDSSTVSIPCDGNPLTYTEVNRIVGDNIGKIRTVEVKDCVTTIGELNGAGTFADAVNMTGVTLPNTLTTIYNRTFWGCTGLTSITLPNSLTYLGNDAFRDCIMASINIPDSVQTIGGLCFFGCTNLTTVVIGTGFTTVTNPGQCFNGCVNLQSVTVKATTPPNVGSYDIFHNTNNTFLIYVPSASVNAYKSASGWSRYASRIQAIR